MSKEPTRTFTQAEFAREVSIGGFMGAYKFWTLLKEKQPGGPAAMVGYGDGVLFALGLIARRERGNGPQSPQEREAYKHCGIES